MLRITDEEIEQMRDLRRAGFTAREIGKRTCRSRTTVAVYTRDLYEGRQCTSTIKTVELISQATLPNGTIRRVYSSGA